MSLPLVKCLRSRVRAHLKQDAGRGLLVPVEPRSFQPQKGKALPIRNLNHFRGLGQLLCEIACCE